jgi:hypothetical protein
MKTPEDEAFDDLARKQGMWGGGFTAKRQAAMDKINTEFHEEYIKYRTAFPKEYTAPQPAQEPVQRPWVGLTDEEIEDAIDDGFAFGLNDGNVSNEYVIRYARVIEAKLRSKNT